MSVLVLVSEWTEATFERLFDDVLLLAFLLLASHRSIVYSISS